MTILVTISPKELERQAALAFEGRPYRVFLASDPVQTLQAASTTAAWEALKLPAENGYAEVTGTIAAGSYNTLNNRYDLPPITAEFAALGAGYTYDCVVVVIDSSTYPHSVLRLSEPQTLSASQSKIYTVTLIQSNGNYEEPSGGDSGGDSGGGSGGEAGQTVLLMHFDGADADRVFTDSSNSGATIWVTSPEDWGPTATSAPALSTLQAKYGSSSLVIGEANEGFNDREGYMVVSLPQAIGTQDFTFEVWFKSLWTGYFSNTTIPFYMETQDSESISMTIWNYGPNATLDFAYSADNSQYLETNDIMPPDQWNHLCVERHLGKIYIYANGVLAVQKEYTIGTFIDNANYNLADKIAIGASSVATDNSGYSGKGWGFWDELRVVIGAGIHQGTAFTPPSSPFSDPSP